MEQVQENPNSQVHYVYVEKKDGCFARFLKLGCGIILAFWVVSIIVSIIAFIIARSTVEEQKNSQPIEYFQVTNGKKEVTIHTGMSKDSVIILLGHPTKFDKTEYLDEITYNYGRRGFSRLTIEFEDGKISSVRKDDNEYIYERLNNISNIE